MNNYDEQTIAKMVEEIIQKMGEEEKAPTSARQPSSSKVTAKDYPLYTNRPEMIHTSTGKSLDEITIDAVMSGDIGPSDVRISPETLELQAQIAESAGRERLAENFRRANELIAVPDQRVLEMYNALRPFRSTKQELLDMANELENQYHALTCAALVREAAEVYEKRGRLKEG